MLSPFGLDNDEAEVLSFLYCVIFMAELAFRRNVDDDSLVLSFAREVGSPEILRLLTVLTMADIALLDQVFGISGRQNPERSL